MQRSIGMFMLGFCLVTSAAFAGPGDPFGGNDTGCVSSDKLALKCSGILAKLLGKLEQRVTSCHLTQASHAFKAGHSAPGFDNAEKNCAEGPAATSGKAKFDAALAKYGPMCGATFVANAEARRDVILDGQMNPDSFDAVNGQFFCDTTSGLTIAEPGGDDGGYIPASTNGFKCSVTIAKAWLKLRRAVHKCHGGAAKDAFTGAAFDDEACEQTAHARYDAAAQKLVAYGICPACVTGGAPGLGADAIADLDAQLEEIYPCPTPATAAPCNDLGGGQCSDTCATVGYECVFVPTGFELTGIPGYPEIHGQDDCRCVPSSLRCENLGSSVCAVSGADGLCPTAAEQCVQSGGFCGCQ